MGGLLNPVPWYYRLLAVTLLCAAVWSYGWVKGVEHETAKFDAFKNQVQVAGAKQEATHAVVAKLGLKISESVGVEYAKGSNDLRRLYGPGRVLYAGPGSSKAASVSKTSGRTDDRPADGGSGATIKPPGTNECEALKSDAAITTREYLFLRDWVEQQQEAWELLN